MNFIPYIELREMKKMQRRLSQLSTQRKPEKVPTLPAFKAPFRFLAQLVRALHQYRSDQGSNPSKPEFFSRLSFRSCVGCVFNCDDLLGIFLRSAAFNRKRRLIVRHGNIPRASFFSALFVLIRIRKGRPSRWKPLQN